MPYICQFVMGRVGGADESPEGDALALMLLVRVEEMHALDGVATVEDQEEGASHALGNPLAGSIFVTFVK